MEETMPATSIDKIRGITAELAAKLKEQKILNSEQLLKAGCDADARKQLAKATGADPKVLLEMLNRADLDRVAGIGAVYSDLLENAGVDTVKELAHRVPANLYVKLIEINTQQKLTTHPPTAEMVTAWVEAAKKLPVVLE